MTVTDVNGVHFEISNDEVKRIAKLGHSPATGYAAKTHEVMMAAQQELREATGDYPEDLEELYEFAAKHELFGDREDTHIMCNFMKVFFGLMQKETHGM